MRSSHRRCSLKQGVLRNFTKFTGKHLCLRPETLLKKRPWHMCFPVIFIYNIYIYIYIYTHLHVCTTVCIHTYKTDNVPSWLFTAYQWPHGNSCTSAHDVRLHIAGTNKPESGQIDIFIHKAEAETKSFLESFFFYMYVYICIYILFYIYIYI